MCTGTLYWVNIGRLVFGAREMELRKLTGDGNAGNMTMGLPCRDVLAKGQKDVEVVGPVEGWEKIIVEDGEKYWMSYWQN
jgi:tRNA(Arg) A34 adenosine deaminase TadA